MCAAQWVLIEEHGMRLHTDLALTIVIVFLVLKLLLGDDLFVFKVDVEENLGLVFFQ